MSVHRDSGIAAAITYPAGGASNIKRLIKAPRGRNWKPGDGNALVDELVVFFVGGLAADRTRGGLLVEDLARFGGKLFADVFALGEELVEHARVKHLRDG